MELSDMLTRPRQMGQGVQVCHRGGRSPNTGLNLMSSSCGENVPRRKYMNFSEATDYFIIKFSTIILKRCLLQCKISYIHSKYFFLDSFHLFMSGCCCNWRTAPWMSYIDDCSVFQMMLYGAFMNNADFQTMWLNYKHGCTKRRSLSVSRSFNKHVYNVA